MFDLSQCNDSQRSAVLATDGPVLMIAGPGTGKTFTLVKRIAYLVMEKHVKPREILCVTFTEKAAKELITRISNEFLQNGLNLNLNEMYIGTFHAVCLRLLKEYSEYAPASEKLRMMDAFEQTYMVCQNLESFSRLEGFETHIRSKRGPWKQAMEVCRYVNQMMEELVDLDAMEADGDADMHFLSKLVRRYQAMLERKGRLDFSSIQTQTYTMLKNHPQVLEALQRGIRYILVDEYQDTNYIQEQLVFMLAGERKNICVVGDDDQGMYRFRGATIRNILEFPDKFAKNECRIIHLDTNYRSEPEIIRFYQNWMESAGGQNLFNWDEFRYHKDLCAGREPILPEHAVYTCGGESIDEEKAALLRMVRMLMENKNISDYNQVVCLFRSVKGEEAKQIGEYFEANGIPVYAPRAKMFFDRLEVRQMTGCLMSCFYEYVKDLRHNEFEPRISEGLREYYKECLREARALMETNDELRNWINRTSWEIMGLASDSDMGLLDVFYQVLAFEPFKSSLQADLKEDVTRTRAARNLSEISRMISRFNALHDMHRLTPENKLALPKEFFNVYMRFLYVDGVGEYEDESEYAPHGCVSFMTIHQAKGLEFPVVVVGSMNGRPKKENDTLLFTAENRFFHRKPYEPMEDIRFFDFWRLYYTAFSRAQNLLILAKSKVNTECFGAILRNLPDIQTFRSNAAFAPIKHVQDKHVYSFTSHIAVYDGCPTQYKFYKEYAFAPNKMFQTSVGSLVHATLEDLNRRVIAGERDGIDERMIEQWFNLNCQSMQEQTGYSLTDEQRENALFQVIRYYRRRKNELGKAWKAEEEINLIRQDYILQGVIDLVECEGDAVEIIDYKTGPKPRIEGHPERVEHYRKQLEIYAYLIEQRYGKSVLRMHLYYTNAQEGDPLITFEWKRENIDKAIGEVSETIRRIERRDFDGTVQNAYACEHCDMRYVCGRATGSGGGEWKDEKANEKEDRRGAQSYLPDRIRM